MRPTWPCPINTCRTWGGTRPAVRHPVSQLWCQSRQQKGSLSTASLVLSLPVILLHTQHIASDKACMGTRCRLKRTYPRASMGHGCTRRWGGCASPWRVPPLLPLCPGHSGPHSAHSTSPGALTPFPASDQPAGREPRRTSALAQQPGHPPEADLL